MPFAVAWFWWGGLGVLYAVLLVTAGVMTFRNRQIVMFILGFVFPLLWIIGAVMSPKPRY